MPDNVKQSPPRADEYNPYYAPYIQRVAGADVMEALNGDMAALRTALAPVKEATAGYRYAPDKWSIKQVLGHLSDAERIFTYRALRMGRADPTPLPGMEQDDYVLYGQFDSRTLTDLVEEFDAVRRASIFLFTHLDAEAWMRRGMASGYPFTVRALAHITAGHLRHHLAVLEARYLPNLTTHA